MTMTKCLAPPSFAFKIALELRKEALDLLRQAQEIDELKPFVVIHGHSNGISGYVCWSGTENSKWFEKFKMDIGDLLVIDSNITLNELTATSLAYCNRGGYQPPAQAVEAARALPDHEHCRINSHV